MANDRMRFRSGAVGAHGAINDLIVLCIDCDAAVERDDVDASAIARYLVCRACVDILSIQVGWDGMDEIAPLGEEEFEAWYPRIAHLISHVPEDVAKNWVHRHWGHSPFEWMNLRSMSFFPETWELPRLLNLKVSNAWSQDETVHGTASLASADTWLKQCMLETRTWPCPIIVLGDGEIARNPHRGDLVGPVLLEGHRRLEYLHELHQMGQAADRHAVWVVRLDVVVAI